MEIKKINKFRAVFPKEISISIARDESGTFLAQIDTFKGLATEGNSFSELIEMVNDAVKTYFEIPREFLPYMPNYVPPLDIVQKLDVFPIKKIVGSVIFPISASEKAAH